MRTRNVFQRGWGWGNPAQWSLSCLETSGCKCMESEFWNGTENCRNLWLFLQTLFNCGITDAIVKYWNSVFDFSYSENILFLPLVSSAVGDVPLAGGFRRDFLGKPDFYSWEPSGPWGSPILPLHISTIPPHALFSSLLLDPSLPMQWAPQSQHKPSGSTGVCLSCVRALRASTGSNQPKQPPLGPPATSLSLAHEPLSAHPGAFSLDLSYMTAPAMATAVPCSQTDIVAWSQPCPVTVDLPGRPRGSWHLARAVRNQ